ncbi:hypothetical protein Mapa_016614 [Marchantia paleacea]|nr:hypothetical protein Mapa_016614 [Marchantia paleacea]
MPSTLSLELSRAHARFPRSALTEEGQEPPPTLNLDLVRWLGEKDVRSVKILPLSKSQFHFCTRTDVFQPFNDHLSTAHIHYYKEGVNKDEDSSLPSLRHPSTTSGSEIISKLAKCYQLRADNETGRDETKREEILSAIPKLIKYVK